jgi:hypothetical protein
MDNNTKFTRHFKTNEVQKRGAIYGRALTGVAEADGEPGDCADLDSGLRDDDEGCHEGQESSEEQNHAQFTATRSNKKFVLLNHKKWLVCKIF